MPPEAPVIRIPARVRSGAWSEILAEFRIDLSRRLEPLSRVRICRAFAMRRLPVVTLAAVSFNGMSMPQHYTCPGQVSACGFARAFRESS